MTLAEYLTTAGMTHKAFADKIGVSQVTVHRWIKGSRFPDRQTILKIEDATASTVRPVDWFRQESAA